MSQFRGLLAMRSLIAPVILALLATFACSRPAEVPVADTSQAGQAPFRDHASAGGSDPSESSAGPQKAASGSGLPFHDSQIPAGTLLTVRLEDAISAGSATPETTFEAVVDEPVVIEGSTLIPRGTAAAGRVESARISELKPSRSSVQLALDSIHVGGLDIPVQTASLFARQTPQSDSQIRLEKGRRLTFRLTEPLYLSTQRAQAGH